MRKNSKCFPMLLFLCILSFCAAGTAEEISIEPVPEIIRPGQAVQISFTVPEDGIADLVLRDEDGELLSVVAEHVEVFEGLNRIWWNGTHQQIAAPEGTGVLTLTQNGKSAGTPVIIGPVIPMILDFSMSDSTLAPGESLTMDVQVTCGGILTVDAVGKEETIRLIETGVEMGRQQFDWHGEHAKDGEWTLALTLTDAEGLTAQKEGPELNLLGFEGGWEDVILIETEHHEENAVVVNDQKQYTPSYGSPYKVDDPEGCFWSTPMDISDEEAVWKMLTSPVTVVDTGKKNAEKTQIVIRAEPSEDAGGVGVVTCVTQSVHVIEHLDNGWSLIECYSSSFHDSRIKAWNLLVQGYVQTSLLKTVVPDQEIGLVVDKLTQRLYIFQNGKLFSTLLVSTGLANARQPYNETRSGEFLIQLPAVGEFRSDNLYCSLGIRFNDGDLIHEVPHMKNADNTKNYSTTEFKLGTRGSHGCIRVQRRRTPEGTNMRWIWNHKKKNMKIVIWEDWQGRQYPYPDDSMPLYYNARGGNYYHTQETCNSAKSLTFSPFTYGELDNEPYADLERCTYCSAPLRKSEIDEINLLHAQGGDHDPVLTEARKKQPAVQ